MKMRYRQRALGVGLLLLLLLPTAAITQEEPVAILEYYSNQDQITVTDSDGFEYNFYIGMDLVPGDTIHTDNANAEIRLDPNGTIVKVAANTQFTVESIQGRGNARKSSFGMAFGKIRTVAANVSGAQYEVRTPGAVGGVRGTDFGIEYREGSRNGLAVLAGEVEFTNLETGESVSLGAGQFADTFAETFQAMRLSEQQMQQLFSELQFEELNPESVPSETAQEEPEEEEESDGDDQQVQQDQPEPGEEEEAAQEESAMQEALAAVGRFLGMEIGSVTINRTTYSKLILQPEFSAGKFRTQLYLPFIYQNDLFNPNDWHKPKGNDEWSFGTDQDWENEPVEAVRDVATDLALKFRYVQYGEQRDPFFVKAGNLDNMTLGHGILMNNYANDIDFPAVRRLGLNTGIDFGGGGFEAVVNDVAEPEIYGGRLYFRPWAETLPLAFGASMVSDIDPAGDLPKEDTKTGPIPENIAAKRIDPIFLNVALDLDFPIIERDNFAVIGFSDIGGMMPYLRDEMLTSDGTEIGPGLQHDVLYDENANRFLKRFRNYGTMTGILGNVLFMDYRLDFRTYNGTFRPFFYDGSYDRLRGKRALETIDYLSDPGDPEFDNSTMGVYGSAGFNLFQERVTMRAAYLWPWEIDNGRPAYSEDDLLELELRLEEGLLPYDIHGGIMYRRSHFIPTLINEGDYKKAELFDENTRFAGEVVYPIAPSLDLALLVTTTVVRNSDGTIRYENGSPVYGPSVSIESRIGF